MNDQRLVRYRHKSHCALKYWAEEDIFYKTALNLGNERDNTRDVRRSRVATRAAHTTSAREQSRSSSPLVNKQRGLARGSTQPQAQAQRRHTHTTHNTTRVNEHVNIREFAILDNTYCELFTLKENYVARHRLQACQGRTRRITRRMDTYVTNTRHQNNNSLIALLSLSRYTNTSYPV